MVREINAFVMSKTFSDSKFACTQLLANFPKEDKFHVKKSYLAMCSLLSTLRYENKNLLAF